MSGIDIVVDGQFDIEMVDFAPAVTRGLVDVKFPRLTAAKTIKDWYDDQDSAIVGSPTYNPSSALLKGLSNYIQTPNAPSVERTIIAAIRTPDAALANATSGPCAGNYDTVNLNGFYFGFQPSGGNPGLYARRYNSIGGTPTAGSPSIITLSAGALNTWRVAAIVLDLVGGNYGIQVFDLTNGTQGTKQTTTSPPILGANLRYGSTYSLYAGSIEIAALFDYNVALTAPERALVYSQLDAFLAEEATPISV